MQIDFHYYCVAVLARAAGFDNEDALTIAHASQYIDDATESELIPISSGSKKFKFDPVLTAYKKIDALKTIAWSAQKRVWIPFHFLPEEPFRPEEMKSFSFVTQPGSKFGRLLLDKAASEPLTNRKRRLCRIGVALHTYADSWSHAGFSGRKSSKDEPEENNVEAIYTYDRTRQQWNHLAIENALFDVATKIGHAQAGYFPDLSFLKWKCTLKPSGREIKRDNTLLFLKAAENIYNQLVSMEKDSGAPAIPWQDIKPKIKKLLANPGEKAKKIKGLTMQLYRASQVQEVEKRCENWKKELSGLFGAQGSQYSYNKYTWRKEALSNDVEWDDFSENDWSTMVPRNYKVGFWDSLWVHFHRAALTQRHLVLENIP